HAGMPAREAVGQEQCHRARRRNIERLADATGVAADQVTLQRGELLARGGDATQVTKDGGDAVELTPLLFDPLDDGARGLDPLDCLRGQVNSRAFTRDRDHLAQREPAAAAKRYLLYA